MSADVKAVGTQDHDVEDSQATKIVNATPIEVLRSLQECLMIAVVDAQHQHRVVRHPRMQGS